MEFTPISMTDQDSLDDLVGQVLNNIRFMREKEVPELPTDEQAEEWTRALFTGRGGKLRRRTNPAKDADDNVRAVFGLMRWHAFGGDLTGLFMAQMRADKDVWSFIETYVACLMAMFGKHSPAVAAWQRTGLFG